MASAYLSRTFGTGNRRTFTISTWLKISNVSSTSENEIFSRRIDSNNQFRFSIYQNKLYFIDQQSNTNNINFMSNSLRRDCNGFYHVVLRIDTTQATQTDRVKLYVNGTEETSFSTSTYPSQNYETYVNQNAEHRIGEWNSKYFDGQMAHFHFTDGYSYGPTTFGETDATTGIWKPKVSPSVTYGTNGFFLKFDNSANMGLDSAGSNNFTTNGTIIQTKDTPSNVFAKINLLDNYYNGQASGSLSVINTKIQTAGSGTETYTLSTLGASKGKYYCEMKLVSSTAAHQTRFGIAYEPSNGTADWLGKRAVGWSLRQDGTPTNNNSTISGTFASYTAGDIISMAVDLDNSKLYFRKNNDAWMNSGDPTSGSTGTGAISITAGKTYLIGIGDETGGYSVCELNFGDGYFGTSAVASAENPDDGNGIFEYDVPAGYRALCTKSINAEEYS